jgi:delta-aminolevulinic acid dehydratase/porphobilinogen synthase
MRDGYLDNDASLDLIAKIALSHAEAGCDMVAPAAMLDGQIQAIRNTLDLPWLPEPADYGVFGKVRLKAL